MSRAAGRAGGGALGRAVLVTAVGLLVFAAAPPAGADVLRLDPVDAREGAGRRAVATVIAPDGGRRPLPAAQVPGSGDADAAVLLAAPDGRHVALTSWGGDARGITVDQRITLVPTDGRAARVLRVSGRAWLKIAGEPVWSADGRELVLGAVRVVLPERGGHRRLGRPAIVRCAAATGRCRRVADSGPRIAAPLPDGRVVGSPVTWPSREVRTPCGWRLFAVEGGRGSGFDAGGRCDRFLDGFLRRPVTLDARIFGGVAGPRTARTWRNSLRGGVPRATTAVASSAGVLIERERVVVRRTSSPDGPELSGSLRRTSALLVSPTGRVRTIPAPNVAVDGGRRHPTVAPMYALPDGGWLGSVGGQNGGRQAELLTITSATGRTRAVRVAGTDATPHAVSRAAGVGLPRDDVQMSLAGYEASTGSAIVVVSAIARAQALAAVAEAGRCTLAAGCPGDPASPPDDPPPGALVRVPLDGRPAVAIEPVADEDAAAYVAW